MGWAVGLILQDMARFVQGVEMFNWWNLTRAVMRVFSLSAFLNLFWKDSSKEIHDMTAQAFSLVEFELIQLVTCEKLF